MNILGISAFNHNSACCLIQDGRLVAAAEEERFSRIKHDAGLPWRAFQFCLDQGKIDLTQVDCIAYSEKPELKRSRQLWMDPEITLSGPTDQQQLTQLFRDRLGYEGLVKFTDHHMAHAASTYYFSSFSDAAVLVADGVGEWSTTSFYRGSGNQLTLLDEVRFPHSLGLFYSTITAYLGFDVIDGESKVMGLASYGKPRYVEQLRPLIQLTDTVQFTLKTEYFDFCKGGHRMYSDLMVALLDQPPRIPGTELTEFHHDLAHSAQVLLEESLLSLARSLHQLAPSPNLCLAGGVALNCVANSRILREGPYENIFIQPAAYDAGGALGAAVVAALELGEARPAPMTHASLGPSFKHGEVAKLVEASGVAHISCEGDQSALLEKVAQRLADGKIIAWFQGAMEFGPRALGNRSILADPRVPDMQSRINRLIKKREDFRPFAPVVLSTESQNWFDIDHPSPYMLETFPVKSPQDLPAITHVDGSARVQTVDESNGLYYSLLKQFHERTGCPVLLNTSMNMKDEPIVCSPLDAIRFFVRSGVDTLVLEDRIIDKEAIPSQWKLLAPLTGLTNSPKVASQVYTFF